MNKSTLDIKKEPKQKVDGRNCKLMDNVLVEIIVVYGETKAEINKELESFDDKGQK